MKRGLPLSLRILLWALLNLLLLGVLAWALFRGQFGIGMDALLAGRAGDRLQSMAEVLGGELNKTPPSEWDAVLARSAAAYDLKLLIIRADGQHLAGEKLTIPPEVRQRLNDRPFGDRPPGDRRFGEPPSGFRMPDGGRKPDGNPPAPDNPPHQPGANPNPPRPESQPPGPPAREEGARNAPPPNGSDPRRGPYPRRPRFFLRAGEPLQYWAGVPMPGLTSPDNRPVGALLLAVAGSLTTGGWVVDPLPWLLGGFGAVLISILIWYPLVRGVTRSLRDLTAATERMADGKFDTAVNVTRHDEIGRLGTAVNHLSGRLEHFVHGQRRFLGDIAHELFSPLARMQLSATLMEREAAANPGLQERVQDVREEVELMSGLVNELLAWSKTGLQAREAKLQPVLLRELVQQTATRESTAKGAVEWDIPDNLEVLAEPELLARAIANLIRNALRYAGHAGPVRIAAQTTAAQILLTVSDSGPGVPAPDLERIFEPFFRPDTARSREAGGTGLGLAIVRTCVEACQGSVTARNRPVTGLEVELRLLPA